MKDPATPIKIVMIQPPGSFPGMRNLAMAPTMRPMIMAEMIPIGVKCSNLSRLADVGIFPAGSRFGHRWLCSTSFGGYWYNFQCIHVRHRHRIDKRGGRLTLEVLALNHSPAKSTASFRLRSDSRARA